MKNPFQTNLRFENFSSFFSKHQFFSLFRTLYCKGEKHEVRKKSFLVLFYSAKSNSDLVTTSNFIKFFFKKLIFFTVLTPYTAQVRKVKSAKNHFLVIFYSAKSISDHFTISELFQVFSKNYFFFTVSKPILQRWETWGQKKIIFSALL